jgi:zinc transport system substrate-binding protein
MTQFRSSSLSTISLLGFLLAAGVAAADRPLIYVGLPPQRWLVRQLAGDRLQVGLLLSPGQNPHTFEPTARQVRELSAAHGYLMMGLPFERALVKKVQATNPVLQVFDVASGVPRRMTPAHAHHPGEAEDADGCCEGADPHVWLTPAAMVILASNTVVALVACDPEGRGTYEARLTHFREQCARLDADLRALLAPVRGGVMLTYHASWGYFTDAYGLRQVAIETEGRAPAARQLAALIDLAKQQKVRRIFLEPPYDPKPGQTLARQIRAEVATIDPLAEDWDMNLRRIAELVRAALVTP